MMDEFSIPDVIGMIGAIIVLTSYFFVQSDRVDATSIAYQVANMLACALIGVSLWFSFNLPSAIVQALWFLISFFGFVKNIRKRRSNY